MHFFLHAFLFACFSFYMHFCVHAFECTHLVSPGAHLAVEELVEVSESVRDGNRPEGVRLLQPNQHIFDVFNVNFRLPQYPVYLLQLRSL